jgi:hypothetical protein
MMAKPEMKMAIEAKLDNELKYIISSMTFDARHNDQMKTKLADSMARSLSMSKRKRPQNVAEINHNLLESTVHYRLAQILKEAKTWDEFGELVATFIPEYKKSPRLALETGNLPWKTAFEVPPKKIRKRLSKKFVEGPKLWELNTEGKETSEKPTPEGNRMIGIERGIQELFSRIRSLETQNAKLTRIIKAHNLNVLPPIIETIEL